MRTVTYDSVLRKACRLWGQDPDTLGDIDEGKLRSFINRRLRFAWEQFWWPELMRTEKRYVRPLWTAGSYAPGAEIYHGATDAVYRALTGVVAAHVPGVSAYWAALSATYEAPDYDASREPYPVGSIVREPNSDRLYQLHTAAFTDPPPDPGRWGEVMPLERYFGWEEEGQTPLGEVKAVWRRNPQTNLGATKLSSFGLNANGVTITAPINYGWVEFRVRPPELDGGLFNTVTGYDRGEQVYFDEDFYGCLEDAIPGQTPVTHPAKWSRLEIPYVFAEYLAQGAYSDMLGKPEGQAEKFGPENDMAYGILVLEFDKVERQQGQQEPLEVLR